jgi:hypothetical protein
MDGRRLRQEGERDGCHGRWRNGGIFSSPEAEGIFHPRSWLKTFSLSRAANWKHFLFRALPTENNIFNNLSPLSNFREIHFVYLVRILK